MYITSSSRPTHTNKKENRTNTSTDVRTKIALSNTSTDVRTQQFITTLYTKRAPNQSRKLNNYASESSIHTLAARRSM